MWEPQQRRKQPENDGANRQKCSARSIDFMRTMPRIDVIHVRMRGEILIAIDSR